MHFITGRIEQLQKNFAVQITWRAFPLHPEIPEAGIALDKLFSASPATISRMISHLRQTAAALNLPFGDRRQTCNSRLAQELGFWAASREKGEIMKNWKRCCWTTEYLALPCDPRAYP